MILEKPLFDIEKNPEHIAAPKNATKKIVNLKYDFIIKVVIGWIFRV